MCYVRNLRNINLFAPQPGYPSNPTGKTGDRGDRTEFSVLESYVLLCSNSRARDLFETLGPSPQKSTCSFAYPFGGNRGFRALCQAIGSQCERGDPHAQTSSIGTPLLLRDHLVVTTPIQKISLTFSSFMAFVRLRGIPS